MNSGFPERLRYFSDQAITWLDSLKLQWKWALGVILFLWLIHLINFCTSYRLNRKWGLVPRTARGLVGICLSLFLHADWGHLLFNSIPLLVLLGMFLVEGWRYTAIVSFYLTIMGGGALWIIGNRAIHIGASGLIMGYIGYMLANAYFNPSIRSIIVASVVLIYFGGSLLSIFPQPQNRQISWQGHLTGLLSGIVLVRLMRAQLIVI